MTAHTRKGRAGDATLPQNVHASSSGGALSNAKSPSTQGRRNHAANAGRHSNAERGLDLYETPRAAVEALLEAEQLPHWVWEPAAGRGAIVNVLRKHGHAVIASDIRDYGFPLHFVADFLTRPKVPGSVECIISNPPFQSINEFVEHALDLCPRVIMLARLAFLESVRRTAILEHRGLVRVHVFRDRLPMMHRDGWTGRRNTSAMAFAWLSGSGAIRDRRPCIASLPRRKPKLTSRRTITMRKFVRQKSTNNVPDVNIDFGAAAKKIARVFEPGEYRLRIESARVIQKNANVLVALDIIELESGGRVDGRPMWVEGPNSDAGNLTAENQHLIAQLLTLAELPTAGNVGALIPKLAGLEFNARLVLAIDNRSSRTYNALSEIYVDDAP